MNVEKCGHMIAQVKKELALDDRLFTESQRIYKVVMLDNDGRYRPALSYRIPTINGKKIYYKTNKPYKVDKHFEYPIFAFDNYGAAIEFCEDQHVIAPEWCDGTSRDFDFAVLLGHATQWARLKWYLGLGHVELPEYIEEFWSTIDPFSAYDVDDGLHMIATPHSTIGMFKFKLDRVIYIADRFRRWDERG